MEITDKKQKDTILKKYCIERFFSTAVWQALKGGLEIHSFRKGEYICEDRKSPRRLYFLVKGRVKLSMIHLDGNITVAQYFEPISLLGELELLGIRRQAQTIQTVTDVICIGLPFDVCESILLSDSVFLQNLSRFLAEKMLRGMERLAATQSYCLEDRLAAYLLEAEEENAADMDGWMKIRLTDLAQYLGCSYRHLSRVIAQFVQAGLIEKERVRLRISNKAALQQRVEQMETE